MNIVGFLLLPNPLPAVPIRSRGSEDLFCARPSTCLSRISGQPLHQRGRRRTQVKPPHQWQVCKCGKEWVWPDSLEYFIQCVTSYNWSSMFWKHDFYTQQQANIISHHVVIPSPNCFILKCFSFSRYRNVSCYDVISVATFQGCQGSILTAHW
jgi:hypothetical protein